MQQDFERLVRDRFCFLKSSAFLRFVFLLSLSLSCDQMLPRVPPTLILIVLDVSPVEALLFFLFFLCFLFLIVFDVSPA